ncbi:MAG: permease [Clostridia bacterium]|nr:permease [Clostridia bacterium]
MIGFVKRYKTFLILFAVNLLLLIFAPDLGTKAVSITQNNLWEMLSVIPPIFILLGLLDVWVKKETMVKYMGEGSGLIGILIAFFLGSAAAGPLYAAFPVAGILLKKGSKISNVLIFIGAWSTMKIPLLMFETNALGLEFSMLRLGMNIFGILIISFVIDNLLKEKDRVELCKLAEDLL